VFGVLTIKYDGQATLCTLHDVCCNIEMANNVRREVNETKLIISRKEHIFISAYVFTEQVV